MKLILIVCTDANRGFGFSKKLFKKTKTAEKIINKILEQKGDQVILYEDFKGNWSEINAIFNFNCNRVYPATEYFKFPANYQFVLKKPNHRTVPKNEVVPV